MNIGNKRIIAIMGPSGAGKTTLGDLLVSRNGFSVSKHATTRNRRSDDKEGFYKYFSHEEYRILVENNAFFITSGDGPVVSEEYGNFYGVLKQDCLSVFNKILEENAVDVLMTVKTSVYSDRSFLEVSNFDEYLQNGFDKERAIDWILYYAKSVGAPNKIIKREIIEKNNLRFLEGYLHEDYDWTFKICLNSNSFCGYNVPWYNYQMVREGSITNHVTAKNITSVIETARIYYDLYSVQRNSLSEKIYKRIMAAVYVSLNKVKYVDESELPLVIDSVKENKIIFKYANKLNQKIFVYAFKLLGAKIAIRLLRKM